MALQRIDFHTHAVPPIYREYCLQNPLAGFGHPDGMPAIPVSLMGLTRRSELLT